MSTFNLPDLGEGLPDAEVREWHVAVGDVVAEDQPLCAMETAKALVDVPSPFSGTITKLHGNPGDVILTGSPLVSYQSDDETASNTAPEANENPAKRGADAGTVVGAIEVGETVLEESATGVRPQSHSGTRVKATLKVRQLAKQLGVDLNAVQGTGPSGSISSQDVQQASSRQAAAAPATNPQSTKGITPSTTNPITELKEGFVPLRGPERGMALAMTRSNQEVADVTLMDDADIHHYGKGDNITLRLIRGICVALKQEPKLNAHYDSQHNARKVFDQLHLALAVDTPGGLYAPVIHDAQNQSDEQLREHIKRFKQHADAQDFPPELLSGATFTLSNFGVFTGRYANPMILPPTVAILGVGKVRQAVVPVNNEPAVHRILPLSITIDHRVLTGGEAARFLAALIEDLQR